MMNDWYQPMIDTLQLNGKGERTQQAYARSVRMLSEFYGKPPDLVTEQELQEYFLKRKNVNHWSPKTMRICYSGYGSFMKKCLTAIGTSWESFEPKMNTAFLLS